MVTEQPRSSTDETQQPTQTPPSPAGGASPAHSTSRGFDAQYRAQSKPVFAEIVGREVAEGGDPLARARDYAERGKPDFVLAYLLVTALDDVEKRALYAYAHERRAQLTEEKAQELDRRFHRPFPLLRLEASKDRMTAQRIRSGGALRPGLGRPLPTL